MRNLYLITLIIALQLPQLANAQNTECDVFETPAGNLTICFVGHASLYFTLNELVVHIDPYSRVADYSLLPKADVILITHEHRDHLDTSAINQVRKENTEIILNENSFNLLGEGKAIKNGETISLSGFEVEAVPAYNIINLRDNGQPYHPKGIGNGYVVSIAGKRIYIAADTENIPEMADLSDIDIAFLPMNLPFTMTPEMTAQAALSFKPRILYPYHFGKTDTNIFLELLSEVPEIEVRIRKF
jgi:L-ascorbate metabolism protein UlaG (beta-lactamase superfamily)